MQQLVGVGVLLYGGGAGELPPLPPPPPPPPPPQNPDMYNYAARINTVETIAHGPKIVGCCREVATYIILYIFASIDTHTKYMFSNSTRAYSRRSESLCCCASRIASCKAKTPSSLQQIINDYHNSQKNFFLIYITGYDLYAGVKKYMYKYH